MFKKLSDEWLDDIARAIDSAAQEGAFGNRDLAQEISDEYIRRERQIPIAYTNYPEDPKTWLRWNFPSNE